MPASSTSSLASRSSSSKSRCRSVYKGHTLLLRAENDFDEARSVTSSASSRSSTSTLSGGGVTGAVSASLATSCVSLRDLELRKSQIERELARVQHELQLRESQHAAARPPSTPAQMGQLN